MKILLTVLICILFNVKALAQSWRYVVPAIEEISTSSPHSGELLLDENKKLSFVNNLNQIESIEEEYYKSYSIPIIFPQRIFLDGSMRNIVVIQKGKVRIGNRIYENLADVYCRHDSYGGSPGGYDDVDPFQVGTIAYIYLVRNGHEYQCILSTSSNGLNTTNVQESLLVGAAVLNPFNFYVYPSPIDNGFVTGGALHFNTNGIRKVTTCQEITVSNFPDNFEKVSIALGFMNFGLLTLSLYDGPGCLTKVMDFDLHWGDFFGEFPKYYVKNKKIYLKATISGTANSTPQSLTLAAMRVKFKIKYFNQGDI